MVPEKKYESLLNEVQNLRSENKKLKDKLAVSGNFEKGIGYRDYESYFNNSLDGIFIMESIYGVPSSFIEVNDAMSRFLGYEKEEIIEFDPLDILAEGEKKRLLNIAENILEQQEIYFLTAFRDKRKQRIPVEISIKTLDSSLNPQLIGVARSVEDKDYSLKLKDSTEELLKKIVSGTHEMVMHISGIPSLRFNYVSPASNKILGFAPEELYANSNIFLRNLHPEDYKTFMALMEKSGGTGLPHIFRFLRKDEKLVWLEIYLTNEDGKSPLKNGVYAIIHDITYRQQMERLINKKLKAEVLMAEISKGFIDYQKVKYTIHETIKKTGTTFEVDCIDLCVGHSLEKKNTYTWMNPKVKSRNKKEVINLENTTWIDQFLQKGDFVYIISPNDIPQEHLEERKLLRTNGVKSMLAAPLQFYGKTMGYLAFYQLDKAKEWDRVEINLITTVAGIINSVLRKEIILVQKDDIFRLASELKVFEKNPYKGKSPAIILAFNRKGEITGCVGNHNLFLNELQERCDKNALSTIFPKNVALDMKEEYQQMLTNHEPRFFSATLAPTEDKQDFGMFFYKGNKCLLCLYK